MRTIVYQMEIGMQEVGKTKNEQTHDKLVMALLGSSGPQRILNGAKVLKMSLCSAIDGEMSSIPSNKRVRAISSLPSERFAVSSSYPLLTAIFRTEYISKHHCMSRLARYWVE